MLVPCLLLREGRLQVAPRISWTFSGPTSTASSYCIKNKLHHAACSTSFVGHGLDLFRQRQPQGCVSAGGHTSAQTTTPSFVCLPETMSWLRTTEKSVRSYKQIEEKGKEERKRYSSVKFERVIERVVRRNTEQKSRLELHLDTDLGILQNPQGLCKVIPL